MEEDSLPSGNYPDPHWQQRGIRYQSTRNVERGMVGTVSSYLWGNLQQLSSGKSDSCLYSVGPPSFSSPVPEQERARAGRRREAYDRSHKSDRQQRARSPQDL